MNPHVKVLIWESSSKEDLSSRTYGHVALETYTGFPNPVMTYMSFWARGHAGECNKPAFHFHQTQEEDDREEREKVPHVYYLTSLNIAKINAAFNAFKTNPNAWGALGWGIFGKAYARDCCGVTMFLLEKGGIFETPYAETGYKLNAIVKNIFFGFGLLYSGINLSYSYRIGAYVLPFVKIHDSYLLRTSYLDTVLDYILKIHAVALIFGKLSMEIDSTKKTNIGIYQRAFAQHTIQALNCEDQFYEDLSVADISKLDESCLEVERYIELALRVSRHLFHTSIISGASLFIFNYMNNRFITSRYKPREIRLLLEKAIHAEQRVAAERAFS